MPSTTTQVTTGNYIATGLGSSFIGILALRAKTDRDSKKVWSNLGTHDHL